MYSNFNQIYTDPWNAIFNVTFPPDRIYHALYLNATRSDRYRYNVQEVRAYADLIVMKGEVYMDGLLLCPFIRLEYRAGRLVEQIRERGRFLRDELTALIQLMPDEGPQARVKMFFDSWINAFQVEIWETLEPPVNNHHDFTVLDMMGYNRSITRLKEFSPLLRNIKALNKVALAFRESERDLPFGYKISDENSGWDNNFDRTHQEPNSPDEPSSVNNNVKNRSYVINFQRGWYQHLDEVTPLKYRNAMMDTKGLVNPDAGEDNIIEMRWLFQLEFAGTLIFFHQVTVPPGKVEGNHQHIGSEELYYIIDGKGIAYLRKGDDPKIDALTDEERSARGIRLEQRDVMGLGQRDFWALPVRPGSMIFTKSGGMHGIRNNAEADLKFVAFLYHQ